MEETDIKCGLLGLDPRTHLLSFFLVGIVSMLIVNLLETVLLQAFATAYLAANGRTRSATRTCVSFTVICGLSFLPLPGLYGVLFVSMLHMIPPFTTGCAFFFGDHVRTRPVASPAKIPRWDLHDIQICLDPSV